MNTVYVKTGTENHWAIAEVGGRPTSRSYPNSNRVEEGGRYLVGLDWDYLYEAWQLMAASATSGSPTRPASARRYHSSMERSLDPPTRLTHG